MLVMNNFSDRSIYYLCSFAIFYPPYWSPEYGSTENSLWCLSKGKQLCGRKSTPAILSQNGQFIQKKMEFVAVLTLIEPNQKHI